MAVDYLPVATGGGALVDTQATFAASTYQQNGFQVGIAQPSQANKVWRQSSMMAAAIANFIANVLNVSVLDDGNLGTATTGLIGLLTRAIFSAANKVVSVAFSATPVFDASLGNAFEITLTGNVTSSTLVNLQPGMSITMIIHQDATGGRTFVPPASLPLADIGATASQTSVQTFIVAANGTSLYPDGPMTLT